MASDVVGVQNYAFDNSFKSEKEGLSNVWAWYLSVSCTEATPCKTGDNISRGNLSLDYVELFPYSFLQPTGKEHKFAELI